MTIRTRFAPSPTGDLHIGGARTALFSWLYAKKNQGQFMLRIEDTDLERSTEQSVQAILDGMQWLGLDYDAEPFFQSKRSARYQQVIKQLLNEGHAYRCYLSREALDALRVEQKAAGQKQRYNGEFRNYQGQPIPGINPVIRFKNPLIGKVLFKDLIHGNIQVSNSELDDLIIARSDGSPTYNLTVVVDDLDMQISHVIRGDDHLNNTPRQINIMRALGVTPPIYAHLPMILGSDGKRLSKRHGAASVMQYKALGYLPKALLNYLVRLGWSHGDQEIFSREEMIDLFSLETVNKAAAAFNTEKSLWLNQHYIKSADTDTLKPSLIWHFKQLKIDINQGPNLDDLINIQKERVKTLTELAESSLIYYQDFEQFDAKAAKKHLRPVILDAIILMHEQLKAINTWDVSTINPCFQNCLQTLQLKMPKLAQPLRVALTGSAMSPAIDDTLFLVGKARSLRRLEKAIEWIKQRQENQSA